MNKEIRSDKERTWYFVKEWVTKVGLTARIHQCVWHSRVTAVAPSLHPFYTGYVKVTKLPTDDEQESLDVHGGVTFTGDLAAVKVEGLWAGFDMAHLGDEERQDLSYATAECEKLAAQLIKL